MTSNEKPIIYFDMDGVLADFDTAFKDYFGITIEMVRSQPRKNQTKFLDMIYHDPDFFETLDPIPHMIDLMCKYIDDAEHQVQILTAVGSLIPQHIKTQKLNWIAKHIMHVIPVNFVTNGIDKRNYACDNALLIDDQLKNVKAFRAAGGCALLVKDKKITLNEF